MGDLPQAERTCVEQNQILQVVTEAKNRQLISLVKNEDGTINHIEPTEKSVNIIKNDYKKIKEDHTLAIIFTGAGASFFVGAFIAEVGSFSRIALISFGSICIVTAVFTFVMTPKPLGGTDYFLETINTNPITILNESPESACFVINDNYPEVSHSAQHSIKSLVKVLTLFIELDTEK